MELQPEDDVEQGNVKGGCCRYPQGKWAVIASSSAIAALMSGAATCVSIESIAVLGSIGLTATIMLVCAICKVMRKCTLIVASVFCFLAAAMKIVDAILTELWDLCGYYNTCQEHDSYYSDYYRRRYYYETDTNNTGLTVVSALSASLFIVAGVAALMIKGKHQLVGRNAIAATTIHVSTVGVHSNKGTAVPFSVGGKNSVMTLEDSTENTEDISRKSTLLLERHKLRQQGVPEAEIDMVLPISMATTSTNMVSSQGNSLVTIVPVNTVANSEEGTLPPAVPLTTTAVPPKKKKDKKKSKKRERKMHEEAHASEIGEIDESKKSERKTNQEENVDVIDEMDV